MRDQDTKNQLETIEPNEPENMEDQNKGDQELCQVYRDKVFYLVDDFIEREYNGKTDEELKQDNGFFERLNLYIYNNYLKSLLHPIELKQDGTIKQSKQYNIYQLDNIFTIYRELVYKYKHNNRPTIIEFCILCGINRDTVNNWINGYDKGHVVNPERQRICQKWLDVCESALVNGSGEYVKEIFLLKSCHGYKDNSNEITVKHEILPTLTSDQLPEVLGIGDKLT